MRKSSALIGGLLVLLSACSTMEVSATPVDVSALQTAAIQTVFAGATQTAAAIVPTDTPLSTVTPETIEATATLSIPSSTAVKTFVPLYWELTWENLGQSEQEISLNWQTNERITLAGYTHQAPLPSNDNAYAYYSNENMANMGWMFVGGWGGTIGTITEFYNETGYFLTIKITSGQSQSIIVWISDETNVVPVLQAAQN